MTLCQLAHGRAVTSPSADVEEIFRHAIGLSRDTFDRHALAWSLTYLGDFLNTRGSADRARTTWLEAIGVFEEFADPHAARLRARLVTLRA